MSSPVVELRGDSGQCCREQQAEGTRGWRRGGRDADGITGKEEIPLLGAQGWDSSRSPLGRPGAAAELSVLGGHCGDGSLLLSRCFSLKGNPHQLKSLRFTLLRAT